MVLETKLIGYWLDSSMTPTRHIKYTTGIAYKRLWAISWLKANRVSAVKIFKFFQVKILSVLESSCVVFYSMLKENDGNILGRPVKILQGSEYTDCEAGLAG